MRSSLKKKNSDEESQIHLENNKMQSKKNVGNSLKEAKYKCWGKGQGSSIQQRSVT